MIGSQAALGIYTEDELPADATASIEVDMTLLDDDDAAVKDEAQIALASDTLDAVPLASARAEHGVLPVSSECGGGQGTQDACCLAQPSTVRR